MAVKCRITDSAKRSLWHAHVTLVHIQAKFREDFLNISAIISKTSFELKEMLHQDAAIWAEKFIKIPVA